ncbi:flagellar protein FlgN [Sphingomonas sp. VNH70]|uniref:flagellar protein FlgN n=1 Tax=Sphingomonas silueang TaxID=3156617 RepID=UPI0032B59E23
MNRREALIRVIDSLHAEIAALQANDMAALREATDAKLATVEAIAADGDMPMDDELRMLTGEARRLNETARIYVNLMAANVRRRIDQLGGGGLPSYRPQFAGRRGTPRMALVG